MRITWIAGLALVALPLEGQVTYDVSFPNAVHHEAEITVTFADPGAGPLQLRMSRSSPGRYALHEFAKNVYDVRVEDGGGNALEITRPNPYQWDVAGHTGSVTVRYTLFADRAGGTYSQVDETHAHLNMPAAFMWGRGTTDQPIRITFHPPEHSGWKAATQLLPTDDPMTFTAPGLYYFLDSPTELSDFMLRTWDVKSRGRTYTIRLAVHHLGTDAEVDAYADMAKKVVAEEIAVYGETPVYDGGTYTFIADYLPYASGDGMEHRNSTILASTGSLERNARGLLGTIAHEYFHSWNVERIRPRSLEPFDFERANMSGALWFAEGFTSYYTPLMLRRAGLLTDAGFASRLSGGLNFVTNAPGRRFFSAVEMSMQAPFVDAARSIDPTNQANTFISYYTWGSVIGLNLDLTLRVQFDKTLDGFMRLAWERFGETEHPYTVMDLEELLGEFTQNPGFGRTFFEHFVRGRDLPDYGPLLGRAGFLVRKARAGKATLGRARLAYDDDGATLRDGTIIGSPLYEAGLDRGARIVALDGRAPRSAADVDSVLTAHAPGDSVPVTFVRRGRTYNEMIHLTEDPRIEVVTYEQAGRPLTEEARQFRAKWLESKMR